MPEAGMYEFSLILSLIHLTLLTISLVPETVIELDKIINKT